MDTHSHLIYSVAFILVILITFILVLTYYLRRLVYLKGSLEDKNREQIKLYEELTASEEELQAQLEELHTTYEELAAAQDKLNFMAYHDFLTGLNNRAGFVRRFEELSSDKNNKYVDIIILDIDNFKVVNDTMGHIFGDKLIREVAIKIRKLIEPIGEIYRIGGDEFIILISCNKTAIRDQTAELLTKIKEEFEPPLEVDHNPINVSFSMGLVSYPEHGKEPDDLLKKADIAMYKSKETNKGSLTVFTEEMLQRLTERKKIGELLRGALDNNEFYLHYQPQLDVNRNKVWGVEALIRWQNPNLGFVSPIDFIGIAEENQEIIRIGQWVLEEACRFIKSRKDNGLPNTKISVNISPVQLVQENFVELVFSVLDRYDISYNSLELEITESIMVESYDVVFAKLSALREQEIKIALDDFGAGYSSLSYLKKLPIDTLKIDRSFVAGIEKDNKKRSVVSTIIEMGRIMNLEVVVEGIETKEQMDYVISKGCHRIQGYYYAKPQEGQAIVIS